MTSIVRQRDDARIKTMYINAHNNVGWRMSNFPAMDGRERSGFSERNHSGECGEQCNFKRLPIQICHQSYHIYRKNYDKIPHYLPQQHLPNCKKITIQLTRLPMWKLLQTWETLWNSGLYQILAGVPGGQTGERISHQDSLSATWRGTQ